jgi:pyruvate dehydrogenase E1 component alpha subunit
MHLFSAEHNMLGGFAFIGEGIPVALGAAYQSRYRKMPWASPMLTRSPSAFLGTAPPTMASSLNA